MPKFIVEMTSDNPNCPPQHEIEAGDEYTALAEVLGWGTYSVQPILDSPHYKGWSELVIRVGLSSEEEEQQDTFDK